MEFRWRAWQAVWIPGVLLVLLLVAVRFFVAPLVPTGSHVLVFQRINGTLGWDVERALKCEEEAGAVVFRDAKWKAEVGCWLSKCGDSAVPIAVVEVSVVACSAL